MVFMNSDKHNIGIQMQGLMIENSSRNSKSPYWDKNTYDPWSDETDNILSPDTESSDVDVMRDDLTVRTMDRLSKSLSAEYTKYVLAEIFSLDDYKEGGKTSIVMDLYFCTLQFCQEQSFSPQKTSAFFSIIKKIFEACIETPYRNFEHTFGYFKGLVNCHSINRPPFCIEIFSCHDVVKMTEYTINSFFKHFKMYKYTFAPMVCLDLTMNYVGNVISPPMSEESSETSGDSEFSDMDEDDIRRVFMEQKRIARERCKQMIGTFLGAETKRIDDNVNEHLKAIEEIINFMIRQLAGVSSIPSL